MDEPGLLPPRAEGGQSRKVEIAAYDPAWPKLFAGLGRGLRGALGEVALRIDFDLAHALKIDTRAIRVARNMAARQARGEIGWAPQLRELIAFDKIAAVLGTDAAAANLVGVAPEEDRDVAAEVVKTVFGRPLAPLALGRQL